MRTFILLAVVVAVASAATAPRVVRPDEAASTPHRDASARGEGPRRSSSGSGAGGYGSGYGGSYYAPPPPPPPPKGDGLDKLDKLFSRVDAVSDQLKTVSEQVTALEARQAVQVKFFDRVVTVTLEALDNTDENQSDRLTQLLADLTDLEQELDTELEPAVENIGSLNDANRAERTEIENLLNEETDLDIEQAGKIARLVSLTADFKNRLSQIIANEVELFDDEVERITQDLNAAQAFDNARTCEVGEVTLDDDECTADITFQTDFGDQAPQIFLGLKGANFNTNAVEDEKSGYGSYGYSSGYGHSQGYHETEPGSIGTRLNAYTTPKGARFEFFFFGFGETKIVGATIQYQVCSVGPGIGGVPH